MNAELRSHGWELERARLDLPEAAWARLRSRLTEPAAAREAWQASLEYGVPSSVLQSFVDFWRDDLELPRRLLDLPCFDAVVAGQGLRFVHAASKHPGAVPLLLFHGFGGSLVELGGLAPALNEAGYDVVSPALPGFGSSCASMSAFVDACAAVMRHLGYARYAVHGSDLGAGAALALAAADGTHVAALHVSHVPAYPGAEPFDLASLTTAEKSRLARLTELHEQLQFQLPETPVEELAFALSRLDEADLTCPRLCEELLTSLTLSGAFGNRKTRAALYRATCLTPAPPSSVPVSVLELPLAAPSLRRFVERAHRVVHWQELESGGPSPAVEQPARLLDALTTFGERLR